MSGKMNISNLTDSEVTDATQQRNQSQIKKLLITKTRCKALPLMACESSQVQTATSQKANPANMQRYNLD